MQGGCHLECQVAASAAGEAWEVFPRRPGCFYIGHLCAPWHRVRHLEQAGPLRTAAGDFLVVVMLRTDVFQEERSRGMKVKPKPCGVFDIVIEVVAYALSARPLHFPDFAPCLDEHLRVA